MRKEERHQIKRDDLATALTRAEAFVEDHVRQVLLISGAAALVVVTVLGVRSWLSGREAKAAALLGEIILTYRAPATASLEALQDAVPGAPTFTSAAERDQKVIALADDLLARYRRTVAGPKALFYRGMALADLGRNDEAAAAFEDFLQRHGSDFVAPMVRLRLARLRESQGKHEEALSQYEALGAGDGVFPVEESILGVARCQEALGRKDEALKTYRRLVSDHPDSDYVLEARRKVDELS